MNPAGHKGLTLPELLVVSAVVMLLLGLLLPVLGGIREHARMIKCAANLRTLGTSSFLHASDNDGSLPASISANNYEGYIRSMGGRAQGLRKRGFIGSEVVPDNLHARDRRILDAIGRRYPAYEVQGMLYQYVGIRDIREIVRCPSLNLAPAPRIGTGVGSNGLHDYSMVSGFTGARMGSLPHAANINLPSGPTPVPVPLFIEEDPAYGCNARFVEMDFASVNRMGTWHRGKTGQYFTTQGGVFTLTYGVSPGPQCFDWYDIPTMRGNRFKLGDIIPVNYQRLFRDAVTYGNQTYERLQPPMKLYGAWQQL